MGTRGIWGFVKNGEVKVTYNHFDSYPSGLGETIKDFFKDNSIEDIKKTFDDIILVNESDEIPDNVSKEFLDDGVSDGKDWYSVLRKSQGKPNIYIDGYLVYMIDGIDFFNNELFCEYGYIINIDDEALEVYKSRTNLIAKINKNELDSFKEILVDIYI